MRDRTDADRSRIIQRGRDAYQDFTLVEEKIKQFEEEVFSAFKNTTPLQSKERDNLWQALHIAGKVLEYLKSDIVAGEHTIRQLDEIRKVGKPSLLQRVLP